MLPYQQYSNPTPYWQLGNFKHHLKSYHYFLAELWVEYKKRDDDLIQKGETKVL